MEIMSINIQKHRIFMSDQEYLQSERLEFKRSKLRRNF